MSFSILLEKARHELIDTTLRNPLIKYRWELTKRGVKVSTSSLSLATSQLVDGLLQSTPVQFLSIIEKPTDKKVSPLQTDLPAEGLQKRLTKLYREARSFQEEQGFNVLYLAFGFLEWYESEHSELPAFAPLLLVPVELTRRDDGKFSVTYNQEEIQPNPSLARKLSDDYGIQWPDWSVIEQSGDTGNFEDYIRLIEQIIAKRSECTRWRVHTNRIALDLFSFAKLAMYEDLNPDRLAEADAPILSTLLAANGSFRSVQGADAPVDVDALTADELDNIVDADSSQTEAIRRALRGDHLVIQGPPGTGKSQTIANLIASFVRQGKKVLFVSEKMAALSVVKRRLDTIGLGQVCLELHSHNARPKDVLAELQRTLQLPNQQATVSLSDQTNELIASRERLKAYYSQITEKIGQTGYSPYDMTGEMVILKNRYPTALLRAMTLTDVPDWTAEQIDDKKKTLSEAGRHVTEFGPATQSPFYGSSLQTLTILDQQNINNQFKSLTEAYETLRQLIVSLSLQGVPVSTSVNTADLHLVRGTLKRLTHKPDLRGLANLSSPLWFSQAKQVDSLFALGDSVNALRSRLKVQVINEALTSIDYTLRQAYQQYGNSWWKRLTSGEFKAAKQRLKNWCKQGLPDDTALQRTLIDELIDHHEKTEELTTLCKRFDGLLPGIGADVFDWLDYREASRYLTQIHVDMDAGNVSPWLLDQLDSDTKALAQLHTPFADSLTRWELGWKALQSVLAFDTETASVSNQRLLAENAQVITQMEARLPSLNNVVSWNYHRQLLEQKGLAELITALEMGAEEPARVYDTFCYSVNAYLLDHARKSRPLLATLYSEELKRLTTEFSQKETGLLRVNRARVVLTHQQNLPSASASHAIGEMGVLHREFHKKTRHLSLRRLLTEAGEAVQRIKPVIMMSPLSIARYVPRESLSFDVVIFDEASQVKPVDAFGALMRAKQAIVVGDDKQMPPTSFFDSKLDGSDGVDTEETENEDDQFVQDTESILGLFSGRGAAQAMLRWHYRSRHDSLIRVSNREFYDDLLIVTPNPLGRGNGLGLRLEPVAGVYAPKTGNLIEAQAVVNAILIHVRHRSHQTLGVVAMSTIQMDLIENELDQCTDPAWVTFRNAHPTEPFFVKNLESVQGDERDVIFVSIGFAKQANGALRMNFGPINGAGGHRRLNVLFSRAKQECVIFTGLTANDIRLGDSPNKGLPVLQSFLQFAATGEMPEAPSVGSGTESPFEESVKEVLERAGYRVDTQIGASGFRIDLGVRHPDFPNEQRYLVGIECDGATYHRSRVARDRDHVRQQVLEGMGWKIYRIWSTDWFHDNDNQQKKLLAHLEASKTNTRLVPAPDNAETIADILVSSRQISSGTPLSVPYRRKELRRYIARDGLHEVRQEKLIGIIAELLAEESPAHGDYIMKRIAEAFNVTRVGDRIRGHFYYVFQAGVQARLFYQKGDFLWVKVPSNNTPVRSRENMETAYRKIEWVAPQEIQVAILGLLRQNQSSQRVELFQATLKLLGFQKLTDAVIQPLESALDELIQAGQVELDKDRIRCV